MIDWIFKKRTNFYSRGGEAMIFNYLIGEEAWKNFEKYNTGWKK